MPTTRAKSKLSEAWFFLTLLKKEAGKDSKAFSYYLRAPESKTPVLDACNRYYGLLQKFLQWAEAKRCFPWLRMPPWAVSVRQ
jgi:hypothetical protein